MKYIELHNKLGEPVLVFLQSIITVYRGENCEFTTLNLNDGTLLVRETPNEIKIKIHG